MRQSVIANFPASPGISDDHEAFLKNIDDIYITDAYHSLSIERYRVTPELIAKVSSGEWDANENEEALNQNLYPEPSHLTAVTFPNYEPTRRFHRCP